MLPELVVLGFQRLTMTDSFDELTTDSEVIEVTRLVCNFIGRISFGEDLERTLRATSIAARLANN